MLRKHVLSSCLVLGLVALGAILMQASPVSGQSNYSDRGVYYGGSVVGGVEVDAQGALQMAPRKSLEEVGKTLSQLLEPIPDDLNKEVPIRKISLKKLDAQMKDIIERRGEFPDSLRYLGGLTAIKYIVVVPEENDLVLVGPAEGWKVDNFGNVIGKNTSRPVLRLEDLITIFRAWNNTDRPEVISCSIDPTAEAMSRIAHVNAQFQGSVTAQNAKAFAAAQEEAYGLNTVTIRGVPDQSRFAKILVAADFKMKRIGLGQESSNVRGLPSYVSLIGGSQKQINPRFWLAPEYGTIKHDSKKRTWELAEVKVKALTDDEYIDARSGSRQSSGKPDTAAINWCSKMNAKYDALSKVDPVFGDLKNCMELAIAVALIRSEGLLEKAGCKLPVLTEEVLLRPMKYPVPKTVPSRATISKIGRTTIVACGGVEINPFTTVQKSQLDSKIDGEYEKLSQVGESWWSN